MSIFKHDKPILEAKNGYFWHISLFTLYPILYIVIVSYLYSRGIIISDISFLDFSLLVLSTFRVTRLFVYDHITDFIRDYLSTFNTWLWKSLSELINCPWCTAVWVAMFLVFLYALTPLSWLFLLILAVDWAVWFLQVAYKSVARWWDSFKQSK
ncbi:MAG: hypothetical protein ACD_2C00081G0003 [uncultured bacterium (gcode 4)]|uniref:DUF1360 domain-containing protein n=1 Tax=uncultured bacterium (gcode 4) TaxID=1234023 RepID=K2FF97_9BACT|nr:MAG: hypothetical protein ACD_2C00081G0003 [uncultured bacterium (gcode 4)]